MYHSMFKDFLKDNSGRSRTMSLFLEIHYDPDAIFTLKDQDYTYKDKLYYSLRRIYMEVGDPTEYKLAMDVFNSWDQWQRMCGNGALMVYIQKWRDELEIRLRSEAVVNIINAARTDETKGLPMMKWVAEGSWKEAKRGRIPKDEKEKEAKKEAGIVRSITDDLKRIKAA